MVCAIDPARAPHISLRVADGVSSPGGTSKNLRPS